MTSHDEKKKKKKNLINKMQKAHFLYFETNLKFEN